MQVFSGKIGSMRKALKSRAEFMFMDAPHEAQGEEAEIRAAGGTGEYPKTWWHWEVLHRHFLGSMLGRRSKVPICKFASQQSALARG